MRFLIEKGTYRWFRKIRPAIYPDPLPMRKEQAMDDGLSGAPGSKPVSGFFLH